MPVDSQSHEMSEPGGRYIDFLGARPLGHGADGRRPLGRRFCDRRYADPQAAETVSGHPHEAQPFPRRRHAQPAGLHGNRRSSCWWSSPASFFGVVNHGSYLTVAACPAGGFRVLGHRPAGGQPGGDAGDGVGTDEPGDAPDVDRVRDLLFRGPFPRSSAAGPPSLPLTPLIDALAASCSKAPVPMIGPHPDRDRGLGRGEFALALRWFRWN